MDVIRYYRTGPYPHMTHKAQIIYCIVHTVLYLYVPRPEQP